VYFRHSYEEVAKIVSGEVTAKLGPSAHHSISWYGEQRHTHSREVRIKNGQKTYPRVKKSVDVSREEWIGVPVPDPGIPSEWVLATRDAIKDNERVSNCGRRFWELTGGVLRCAACGSAMATNYITRVRQAITAVARDIGSVSTPAHGVRISRLKRPKHSSGDLCRESSKTLSDSGAAWMRC
jgi:hypothetical protein